MKDPKTIIIIVLAIACAVLAYIAFKPGPAPMDQTLINKLKDSLKTQDLAYKAIIETEANKSKSYIRRYDSLSQLPPKIKIKYEQIDKKIDNAHSSGIISGLDSLWSNHNVK